jgi:hypothetical protein
MVNGIQTPGHINQDDFNKFLTTITLAFFMVMYVLVWWTGKPMDWTTLLTFIVPIVTHSTHIVAGMQQDRSQIQRAQVAKDVSPELAQKVLIDGIEQKRQQ